MGVSGVLASGVKECMSELAYNWALRDEAVTRGFLVKESSEIRRFRRL